MISIKKPNRQSIEQQWGELQALQRGWLYGNRGLWAFVERRLIELEHGKRGSIPRHALGVGFASLPHALAQGRIL